MITDDVWADLGYDRIQMRGKPLHFKLEKSDAEYEDLEPLGLMRIEYIKGSDARVVNAKLAEAQIRVGKATKSENQRRVVQK